MATILDLLVETLMRRFSESGFDVPQSRTAKDRESFVVDTLENAAILPQDLLDVLIESARNVVNVWDRGDLAAAVRNLSSAIEAAETRAESNSRKKQLAEPTADVNLPTTTAPSTTPGE